MISLRTDPVRVAVPATSANLGSGFDSLGLALDLADEVVAQAVPGAPDHVSVVVTGEGDGTVPTDGSHLVVRTIRDTWEALGVGPAGVRLECRNRIPHARGLGSSAAAIVAGVTLARAMAGLPEDPDWVLERATAVEGHPDNVAACVLGGLTVAWLDGDGRGRALGLGAPAGLAAAVLVPQAPVSTATVRALLPTTVPHRDAAFAAGRAALLVAAATAGRTDLLLEATDDRLHQPYRAGAMPESLELVRSLRADGLAAMVSGAGPTVLVLGDVQAVDAARRAAPWGWWAPEVAVSGAGVGIRRAG